ncbi:unnamed protein product [Heterobilharzia americana]|nr:unnamed protein product [Heterobilharzia americana]
MVKSGTLVEFASNKICSEQTEPNSCSQASMKNVLCHWCSSIKVCSNRRDTHRLHWINANCSTGRTITFIPLNNYDLCCHVGTDYHFLIIEAS